MNEPAEHVAVLRRHGMQVTAQRVAVLRAVSKRSHATATDIEIIARAGGRRGLRRGLRPLPDRRRRLGFTIDEADVTYWGRCPDCLAASAVRSDG